MVQSRKYRKHNNKDLAKRSLKHKKRMKGGDKFEEARKRLEKLSEPIDLTEEEFDRGTGSALPAQAEGSAPSSGAAAGDASIPDELQPMLEAPQVMSPEEFMDKEIPEDEKPSITIYKCPPGFTSNFEGNKYAKFKNKRVY